MFPMKKIIAIALVVVSLCAVGCESKPAAPTAKGTAPTNAK
jgi:hypothetical protein